MKTKISDLSENQEIEISLAVRSIGSPRSYKDTSKKEKYLNLELTDSTGVLNATYFGNDPTCKDIDDFLKLIQIGKVYRFNGKIQTYNGKLQILIDKNKPPMPDTTFDPDDFFPSVGIDLNAEFERIETRISIMKNRHLKSLLCLIIHDEKYKKLYLRATAAMTRHHSYLGGLMQHTNEMIKLADTICEIYPNIQRDILIAGCILHDFGKIFELNNELTYSYSDVGKLQGHISITNEIADEKIKTIESFPDILKLQITHLILSHHGEHSAIKPKTIEAVALHHIDNLDAQVNRINFLLLSEIDKDWVKPSYSEEYFNTLKVTDDEAQ